ncbi:DoxX family protein [Aquabacter sp. CN5-332]|uniref:DoxX family protein n=1 Tax=Aquabacter sp. CN5-332 TaxID=3156608 RepID=UPI0032B47AA9
MTPSFIASLLESRIFGVFARIVFTFVFWSAGLAKAIDFQANVAEMTHFGLNPPAVFAVATVVTLLVASLLVIFNVAAWLGCGALAVFVALTIPIAHPFWTMTGDQGLHEFYVVVEHVTVIGGLMVCAILCHRLKARG